MRQPSVVLTNVFRKHFDLCLFCSVTNQISCNYFYGRAQYLGKAESIGSQPCSLILGSRINYFLFPLRLDLYFFIDCVCVCVRARYNKVLSYELGSVRDEH